MNTHIVKYFLITAALFICYFCKPVVPEEEQIKGYSISLGEFQTFDDADMFKSKMDFGLWHELKILNVDTKRFVLLYSNFESSFDAGQKAFVLFNKGLISNYKIFKEKNYVRDDFSNVFFIAKYQGRPSIYNYNMTNKKSTLIWSRWGRKVSTLNHSDDNTNTFFTTSLGYGKRGSFPYVRDAKVYHFSNIDEQFNEIEELGSGLQLYSYWENKDTFKVNFTKPDSIQSDIIQQYIYSYHRNGEKGSVKSRSFSLLKDGFPKPPEKIIKYFSNNRKLLLRKVINNKNTIVYLKNLVSNSEEMILDMKGNLANISWSPDDKYLFLHFSIPGGNSIMLYQILIIDTETKQIINNQHKSKYPNLLVHGNFIYFDVQSEGQSKIVIYDYTNDNIYDEFSIPGGSGLNQLSF